MADDDRIIKAMKEDIGTLLHFVFVFPHPDFKLNSLRSILSLEITLAWENNKELEYRARFTRAKELLDGAELELAKTKVENQNPQIHAIRINAGEAQDILVDIARKERWVIMDTQTLGNMMSTAREAGISMPGKME